MISIPIRSRLAGVPLAINMTGTAASMPTTGKTAGGLLLLDTVPLHVHSGTGVIHGQNTVTVVLVVLFAHSLMAEKSNCTIQCFTRLKNVVIGVVIYPMAKFAQEVKFVPLLTAMQSIALSHASPLITIHY